MSVEVGFDLKLALDDLHKTVDKIDKRLTSNTGIVNQEIIAGQIAISAGTGTLDPATAFEPITGFVWSVRRLTAYGYTAGTVTGFISGMEPVAPFPSAGVFTYPRGALILMPGEKLTFTATGITLASGITAVQIWGRADAFPVGYLSEYLD